MLQDKSATQIVTAPRTVQLPRHKLRGFASTLQHLHRPPPLPPPPTNPITVVCISDTHCTQPQLPTGDLLLHAGDLSEWGTFTEIQAQLRWLSQQPHRYKVIIAGNHDLLLDQNLRKLHPQRWKQAVHASAGAEKTDDEIKTAADLDWGDVIYLQNTSTTLTFDGDRQITIYGSPYTPQHGLSAFQHPPATDIWSGTIPFNTDILLTHGPSRGHLDGVKKSGCTFLAQEIAKVRPRLVVFGHIHVGYGMEERVYDRVGRAYEGIIGQWGGWGRAMRMCACVGVGSALPRRWRREQAVTTFVNAAVVEGWEEHVIRNEAVVVKL